MRISEVDPAPVAQIAERAPQDGHQSVSQDGSAPLSEGSTNASLTRPLGADRAIRSHVRFRVHGAASSMRSYVPP
jgi:hypothetical protein